MAGMIGEFGISEASRTQEAVGVEASGRVLLAAGGTGGHISPAIALSEALGRIAPGVEVQFCCGHRPTELQLYRRQGIRPWVLPVAHNRPGLLRRLGTLGRLMAAWRRTRRLLRAHPVAVAVGFGSYISVPPMLAARSVGASLIIHEQNVLPGRANRMLAPLARVIATACEPAKGQFNPAKVRVVGTPIRASFLKPVDPAEARDFFRLSADKPVCLVIGGSQGAMGINQILLDLAGRMRGPDSPAGRWQLLWSTGPVHYQPVMKGLRQMGVDVCGHSINPFIEEMAMAYAAADLVVARSGASTQAELTVMGRPAVLIPLPHAGDHQRLNAQRLEQVGAAHIIEQGDPRAAEKLESMLGRLDTQPVLLERMRRAARSNGFPDAAERLARVVLDFLPNPKQAGAIQYHQ